MYIYETGSLFYMVEIVYIYIMYIIVCVYMNAILLYIHIFFFSHYSTSHSITRLLLLVWVCLSLPIGPSHHYIQAYKLFDPLTTKHYTDQGTCFKAKKVQQWAHNNWIYQSHHTVPPWICWPERVTELPVCQLMVPTQK